MGRGASKEGKNKAAGDGKGQNPREWGETLGAERPPYWTPSPTEWKGRRGVARPPEWRKTLGGAATECGGGVESSPDDSTRHREGGGVESSWDNTTPQRKGRWNRVMA